jgi:hypothetical protein
MCIDGEPERLGMCLELARIDWRDILVGEGLGNYDCPKS